MALPLIPLAGPPLEQGRRHGRLLRVEIARNLTLYFERFRGVGLTEAEVLARARRYAGATQTRHPAYFDTMRGIAGGSGQSLDRIAALNVRYEIMYYQFGAGADGCSAFAVSPERSSGGHLLMGQNWDWLPEVAGALLHTTERDGLEHLAFTEAGIAGGKIGLNSAGLGLAVNGLVTLQDDWQRLALPFHVRCYDILRQRHLSGARAVVESEARACSANFLLAQAPGSIVDLEAGPDGVHELCCDGGQVVHTNHFFAPDVLGVTEPESDFRPHSLHRCARLGAGLRQAHTLGLEDVMNALRDHDGHPNSVCRHPDLEDEFRYHFSTVTSVVMDLTECVMHISDGPPCESAYQRHALAREPD